MSLDLFRLSYGIDIQTDDLSSNAYVLQGIGAPGGDGDVQDDAPIGSIYMRTDAAPDELQLHYKYQDTNSPADWRIVTSKEYVDAAVQGISWREPATLLDPTTYADITAAETAMNNTGLDGQAVGALANGDRVLFTDLTTGNENVYIVTGTPGAGATLVEDSNLATDGDAILINEGTGADQQWIYDGTQWIQFGGAGSSTELVNIRNFIGKDTAGATFPDYPSTDIVVDGQPLDTSIGRLDDAMGDMQFTTPNLLTSYADTLLADGSNPSAANVTTNLQAIDDALGDGNIAPSGANHLLSDELSWFSGGGTLTITDAIDALNEGVGDRSYTDQNIITDGETIVSSLDALDQVIGDIDNTSAYTAGGFLDATTIAGNDIQETLDSFNQEIGDIIDNTQENTGSITAGTPTVVDTIPATEATEIKWMVQAKLTADGTTRTATEVHAMTNGTDTDWNRFSVLRLNGGVGNVGLSVGINAGNVELSLTPVAGIDYTVKRISTSFL